MMNKTGFMEFGSDGWDRTSDTWINSPLLLPTELHRNNLERGTRIELATTCLEGRDSTN